MNDSKVVLFQVRVMFKFSGKKEINFKIITDTENGIKDFIDRLGNVKDIEDICVEYLCEYDCSRLGVVKKITNFEVIKNEKV